MACPLQPVVPSFPRRRARARGGRVDSDGVVSALRRLRLPPGARPSAQRRQSAQVPSVAIGSRGVALAESEPDAPARARRLPHAARRQISAGRWTASPRRARLRLAGQGLGGGRETRGSFGASVLGVPGERPNLNREVWVVPQRMPATIGSPAPEVPDDALPVAPGGDTVDDQSRTLKEHAKTARGEPPVVVQRK